ncbi:MAG: F0F1 ATP synthase subunit B [Planctomycetes bacterium]|nr:F0F1 ATP synthase subunit B [Planctomycetota bacterium]
MFAALVLAAEGGGFNPFSWAPGAAFWSWVIFLGALPFMWKFVFGPITRALSERDQRVIDAASAAEQAKREAEEAVAAARAEREQARAEARKMVEEATARAERQGEEALRNAKAEAERQLQQVREDIEASKQKALEEIRTEVVTLAMASARQILKRELDPGAHQKLVDEFLDTVSS